MPVKMLILRNVVEQFLPQVQSYLWLFVLLLKVAQIFTY
jgi:hypothetical protein